MADKVVLITGASRGLGLEIARDFAGEGYGLALTARGTVDLQKTSDDLARWTDVLALAGDVADPVHAERLVRETLHHFGRIDVLVNNASTLGPTPMPELRYLPPDALTDVFRVNTVAPMRLTQLVLPGMRDRGEGIIINVTSDAGVEAYPGWGGYGAGKAALEHLSRVLAAELEGSGVRVYIVDPGDMDTEMHRAAEPGVDLSDLPGPDVPAPAFRMLVECETVPFGRFRALDVVAREPSHAGS